MKNILSIAVVLLSSHSATAGMRDFVREVYENTKKQCADLVVLSSDSRLEMRTTVNDDFEVFLGERSLHEEKGNPGEYALYKMHSRKGYQAAKAVVSALPSEGQIQLAVANRGVIILSHYRGIDTFDSHLRPMREIRLSDPDGKPDTNYKSRVLEDGRIVSSSDHHAFVWSPQEKDLLPFQPEIQYSVEKGRADRKIISSDVLENDTLMVNEIQFYYPTVWNYRLFRISPTGEVMGVFDITKRMKQLKLQCDATQPTSTFPDVKFLKALGNHKHQVAIVDPNEGDERRVATETWILKSKLDEAHEHIADRRRWNRILHPDFPSQIRDLSDFRQMVSLDRENPEDDPLPDEPQGPANIIQQW